MVTELSYCPDGGWLVSEAPIPSDPADHWTHGVGDVFGCNHLVCGACGKDVQVRQEGYFARLYWCDCTKFEESERRLAQDDERDAHDIALPWSCGGHPPPELPVDVEGRTLDAGTDWAALVRGVLDGVVPDGAMVGWKELPASWLGRVFHRLRGLPESVAFARVIGDALDSDRPEDVGAALLFFRWWPHAPGSERVLGLADRVGGTTVFPCPLRDISTPESPAITLGAQARASEAVEAGLVAHLRRAAVSEDEDIVGGGRFEPLIQALATHDGAWAARNAVGIGAGDGERAGVLLRTLRGLDQDELVVVAGVALKEAGGYDAALESFLGSAFSAGRPFVPVLRG